MGMELYIKYPFLRHYYAASNQTPQSFYCDTDNKKSHRSSDSSEVSCTFIELDIVPIMDPYFIDAFVI